MTDLATTDVRCSGSNGTGPAGIIPPPAGPARRAADLALMLVVGALAVVGGIAAWSWLTGGLPTPDRVSATEQIQVEDFVARTGTELVYVAETAGGGMIDIRYRVIDPEKALIFHDETLPVALYQPGGVFLERPFHEHSHDVELHPSVVYNELIVNLESSMGRGDVVTLIVGPYRLENVEIQ